MVVFKVYSVNECIPIIWLHPQPQWTRERTRSVMGRLESSDASKSTSSNRKSSPSPVQPQSCKTSPALGLAERKLLFEFQQNHENALLRLAHLLKASAGQLREMLQWTTAEFDDRMPAGSPSRIARPTMTPENALKVRYQLQYSSLCVLK